ncbi:hypothetical protein [Leifsonia sp. TF02-11]|uniref:hypothetical protein n=1 Tax=Leifsonia sp. TF02-11 TaxID=2815212 RepID=UPI001AA0C776|nr:hypothetical protein [Leifsonia sp. TF02-11]MBO1739320.1 hypothetical protein [Leifsonia sp. TF02-11]
MTSKSAATQAIDVQQLLGKPAAANAAIKAGLDKITIGDESYGVARRFLERRMEVARSTRTVGLASTALLVAMGGAFYASATPAAVVLWIAAAALAVLSLFASMSAAADERRITELEVRTALNHAPAPVAQPGHVGRVMRSLAVRFHP